MSLLRWLFRQRPTYPPLRPTHDARNWQDLMHRKFPPFAH